MSSGNGAVSFDFLGDFWNITSCPNSHALSEGSPTGSLRRCSTVSIEVVPLALSLRRAAHVQEWALVRHTIGVGHFHPKWCFRLQAVPLGEHIAAGDRPSSTLLWVTLWLSKITGQWLTGFHKHCLAFLVLHFVFLNWKITFHFCFSPVTLLFSSLVFYFIDCPPDHPTSTINEWC